MTANPFWRRGESWIRTQVDFYDFIFAAAIQLCPQHAKEDFLHKFADGKDPYEDAVRAIEKRWPTFEAAWEDFLRSGFNRRKLTPEEACDYALQKAGLADADWNARYVSTLKALGFRLRAVEARERRTPGSIDAPPPCEEGQQYVFPSEIVRDV